MFHQRHASAAQYTRSLWADDANLCVTHHSFATGYPGYRDLWSSPFLGRLSSHPWGAMRFIAAFLASGILDRYENLSKKIDVEK